MGWLSDTAQSKVQAGDTAPYWRLEIGKSTYTSSGDMRVPSIGKAFKITGGYGLGGDSSIEFEVLDPLDGLEDTIVRLHTGYGPPHRPTTVEYFTGRLQEPDERGAAKAFGSFKLMAEQYFGEQVTYQGVPIEYFFRDITRRAGPNMGQLEVRGGRSYTLEKEPFTEETSLLEGAESVTEAANFVFFDRPRLKRLAMPAPQPGQFGRTKATYLEGHYPAEGFTVTPKKNTHYSKVVVFRRNDDGSYAVRAVVKVPARYKANPLPGRIFYIAEFPGTQADAQAEAARMARSLAAGGEFDFELVGIPFNPEIEFYDTIEVHRTIERFGFTYYERYACQIEGGLGFDIDRTTYDQDLSGRAIRLEQRLVLEPRPRTSTLTPGVMRVPA